MRYHHVEVPAVDGIPIEVHFFPSYMHAPWRNKRLQRWFECQASEQFANRVVLPGTDEPVSIPTSEFNVIYQLQHMFSHLFTEGFGLRQVVDYYFVLKAQNDGRDMIEDVRRTLRYLGLWKFAGAMMWGMKEVLHLDEKYMIAEPNEKEGRFLLSEIMQSGNMGHYDKRLGKTTNESITHRYFRMTLRNMRFVKHYPEEALCEPFLEHGISSGEFIKNDKILIQICERNGGTEHWWFTVQGSFFENVAMQSRLMIHGKWLLIRNCSMS